MVDNVCQLGNISATFENEVQMGKNYCIFFEKMSDLDHILHYLTVVSFNDTISGERTGFIVPVSSKLHSILS